MPDIETFLCACLRGEGLQWPYGQDESLAANFIERASYHGVLALMHEGLQRDELARAEWPQRVIAACREGTLAYAMWELRHRALLTEALAELAGAELIPVVFKGTALAYTLYPEAVLRSRSDTDLIIPSGTHAKVVDILGKLGFERESGVSGENIAYEASFTHVGEHGDTHTLDLHWRINNSELLSKLFSYEELLAQAQPIPALGPHARAAGPVHAMLIACMHRATHKHNPYYVNGVAYYSGDRLVWLYDLHLLAAAFMPEQWDEFLRLAGTKGLCAVCLEGLERAGMCFQTATPERVRVGLAQPGGSEKLARYFAGSALRQQWMDFCALPGIARKLRFIDEAIFPPADYMRAKYPQGGWLPWLYFRRALQGVLKRLR